jgi:hypothetical protein
VQSLHDQNEELGREGVPLPKSTPIGHTSSRRAIEEHLSGGSREKGADAYQKTCTKAHLPENLEEKLPVHCVKSLGIVKLQEDRWLL